MANMNNDTYEAFLPNSAGCIGVRPDVTLTYRIAGQMNDSKNSVLSQPNNAKVRAFDSGWQIVFNLLNPALKPFLPEFNSDDYKWGIDDKGQVFQIIIPIPPEVEDSMLSILKNNGSAATPVKAHTFDRCEKDFKKICSDCESCQEKTFEATPDAELWLLQEGMLGKNEVERDMADATAQLGNNKELLKAYIQRRSQGESHDVALANVRAMINQAIQQPTLPPDEEATINNIAERKKVPVKGMDIMQKAKTYAKKNKVSYEAALLELTPKGE